MLQHITSKIREIVKDAQKTLPVESAAAIEGVYGDILNLNNSINKKLRALRVKKINPEIAAEIETLRNLEDVILQMFNLVQDEMDKLRKKEHPLSIQTHP